ncbi:phosphoribosylglycinamide formyltransferase [Tardibacter chloracetimidivorans]|uniref:Phosphoribosylglycinamide formyltransferase n=1 Tax=Tardibacter chloracetimidivorans TaxID=1921510 RepID=A0A1L3ZRG2_9SPHN|nr:phosphoribosylglycinamide formyltransferase [Tardibacter chloracetimidivorans]API58216.1 phosphoribosylglycinamide formyltransferase [Tardibacter chloracetimidivorans]
MAERKRVGILISGRGSNMSALVAAAQAPGCPYEVALVFSNVADAPGLAIAEAAGVPTASLDHRGHGGRALFDAKVDAILRDAGCDLVALAGYMRLLSDDFVAAWEGRMINIHPSLLPSFKGVDTHARAIAAGCRLHGCTVHLVTPELDSGPIIAQAAVPVMDDDTPDALAARVLVEEHRLYPQALAALASGRLRVEGQRVLGF